MGRRIAQWGRDVGGVRNTRTRLAFVSRLRVAAAVGCYAMSTRSQLKWRMSRVSTRSGSTDAVTRFTLRPATCAHPCQEMSRLFAKHRAHALDVAVPDVSPHRDVCALERGEQSRLTTTSQRNRRFEGANTSNMQRAENLPVIERCHSTNSRSRKHKRMHRRSDVNSRHT